MANKILKTLDLVTKTTKAENSNTLNLDLAQVNSSGSVSGSQILAGSGGVRLDSAGTPVDIVAASGNISITGLAASIDLNGKKIINAGVGTAPSDYATLAQVTAAASGAQVYVGAWDASTNSPTIVSSIGVSGQFYIIQVAGSTSIDGITDWKVGDQISFNGGVWQKFDNTSPVISVNGLEGAVVLDTDNISEGTTNKYFTDVRAQTAAVQNNLNSSSVIAPSADAVNNALYGGRAVTTSAISAVTEPKMGYCNGTDSFTSGVLTSSLWSTSGLAIIKESVSGTGRAFFGGNGQSISFGSWSWSVGQKVFVTDNGVLSQSFTPTAGQAIVEAGFAISPTELIIQPRFDSVYV